MRRGTEVVVTGSPRKRFVRKGTWVRIPPSPPSMIYVYFLSLKNNSVYTGLTSDLRRRIAEHKNGKVESTRNYRPVRFIGYEAYLTEGDARRREKFLKTTEGKRLFQRQYRDVLGGGSPRHATGRPIA